MTEHAEAIPRFPLAWPLGWPRHKGARQRAPFSTKKVGDSRLTVIIATQRLEQQLDALGATNPILSTNVSLRLDGRPRSDEEPRDPGAAVYFAFKGKATVLAGDRFNRVADNIAAIAGHIEALRRCDRYGVGSLEQALAGYKALPADSAADWRAVFGFKPGPVTLEQVDQVFKEMARERHPDRGGSDEAMQQINRARDFAIAELKG
jgi:hypothetical protein